MTDEVKIKNTTIVQPAKPSFNGNIILTELDILGSSSFVPYPTSVYFYKPNDDNSDELSSKYFTLVRDSLSRTLVHFYPLAGRLMTHHHHNPPTVVLQCGSACADGGGGVVLIEAESSKELADFGDFSDHCRFTDLIPSVDDLGYDRTNRDQIHNIPLTLVQLTIFRCGGLSIGISTSHVIDGRSFGHFMKEWARISRGEPLEKSPFMDRTILLKDVEQAPSDELNPNQNDVIDENLLVANKLTSNTPVKDKKNLKESEMTTMAILPLTKTQVENLKRASTTIVNDGTSVDHKNDANIRPYSRYEVISAYTWRCLCKAKGYTVDSDVLTKMVITVDVRGRVQPSLPPEYFGNGITLGVVNCQAGKIISNQLAFTCEKLRRATNHITDGYIRTDIKQIRRRRLLLSSMEKNKSDVDEGRLDNMDLSVTNWLQLPFNNLDFGWGKQVCMRRGPITLNGTVAIMSGDLQGNNNYKHDQDQDQDKDGISIFVVICLLKVHMDNFKRFFYEDLISY